MKMNTLKTGILLLAASATIVSCKKEGPTVTADKATVEVGELVSLNCLATDEAMKSSYVTWDFGDEANTIGMHGNTEEIYNNSNALVVSHKYAKAGTYTVAAIVNKSKRPTKKNATSTYGSTTITVVAAKADFTASKETGVKLGERVALTNTTTSNSNKLDAYKGSSITFNWEYKNNATGAVAGGAFGGAADATDNTIMFNSAGTYTVTLWAIQGASKSALTKTITVGTSTEIDPESTVDKLLGAHSSLGVSASYAISVTNNCETSNTPTSQSFSNVTFKQGSSEESFDVYGVVTGEGDQLNGERLMTITLDAKGTATISNKYNSPTTSISALFNLLPGGTYQYTSTGLKYKDAQPKKCNFNNPAVDYTATTEGSITW